MEENNKIEKKTNSDKDAKMQIFQESEQMLKQMMSQELKEKLINKINSNDPAVINAIKALISEKE